MQIRTSKNLTLAGIFTILGALAVAGLALFDGNDTTNVNFEATFAAIAAGVGMIMAKGQANTGGTVPATPEAAARVQVPPSAG
jgi:hypothetical protein